jgi:HSP20 family molecular chaperone IbpA
MNNALTTIRPSLLGRNVLDNFFDDFFVDFPRHLRQSTSGFPVTDIYRDANGNTVLEFALAGFRKDELKIDIHPEKRSITVSANNSDEESSETPRRIARRSFTKTYVNYDNNLDLSNVEANFDNGLLAITVPQRAEVQPVSVKIG